MPQEQGEEDTGEGGREDAALLHIAFHVKGIEGAALNLDCCLHVVVE